MRENPFRVGSSKEPMRESPFRVGSSKEPKWNVCWFCNLQNRTFCVGFVLELTPIFRVGSLTEPTLNISNFPSVLLETDAKKTYFTSIFIWRKNLVFFMSPIYATVVGPALFIYSVGFNPTRIQLSIAVILDSLILFVPLWVTCNVCHIWCVDVAVYTRLNFFMSYL